MIQHPTPGWTIRPALLTSLLVLLLPATPAAAQPSPLERLDEYIEAAMPAWEVPGLAVAVVRNDSVIYARGFGVRRLGSAGQVDAHTLFAIASTSKAFTAGALGMLVDEDRVDWDDRVSEHLPSFLLNDAYVTRELTVRDLLTHRVGLSRSDNLWVVAPYTRTEVLERARDLDAPRGFRAQYGYNNLMYIAAGEVVGAASGSTWEDFVERRMFQPLNMTRSTARSEVVAQRDNVSAPHTRSDGRVMAGELRNYDNIGGAGAIFSSVHDMAQWVRLQLGEGTYEGKQLIRPTTLREMHTPQTVIRSDTVSERLFPTTSFRTYGLGWWVEDYHGRKLVHHSGSVNWTRTHVAMIPSENIGVVVIANLSSSNLQKAVAFRVLDTLLGVRATDWSAEYLAIAQRGQVRSAAEARRTEERRVAGTKPTLPLASYAATYRNAVYGDVPVAFENGSLVLRYSDDYTADLEHWHYDTFRAKWRRPGFGWSFVTFALDSRGRPATMNVEELGETRRVDPEDGR